MTEVNLDSIFASLESSAEDLNAASDEANRVLADVEERLVGYNIGFETWYGVPLTCSDSEGGIGAFEKSEEVVDVLGFAQIDKAWCLAVKKIRRVSGFYQGDEDCPYTNEFLEAPAVPLLNQSRELRTRAATVLPDFLSYVAEEIRKKASEIGRATSNFTA